MNYLVKSLAILVLLVLGILMISPLTTISQLEKPAIYNDPLSFGGVGDLKLVEVNDNETHLLVHSQWDNVLPIINGTYVIIRRVALGLDADVNPLTGYGYRCYRLQLGYDAYASGYSMRNGTRSLYIYWFSSNGSLLGYTSNNSYIVTNDSGTYLTLPTALVNLSTSNRARMRIFPSTSFIDKFPVSTYNNTTINYTSVTIDGNDNEWNLSNSTLALDFNDNYTTSYPGANITGIYIASDDNYLYLLLKLASPINESFFNSSSIDQAFSSYSAFLYLDTNNDGLYDYSLGIRPSYVTVLNYSSSSSSLYNVPAAWNTSNVEIALNLSYIGLTSLVGQNITIKIFGWLVNIYDNLVSNEKNYGFLYEIGVGGEFVTPINNYCECGCTIPAGLTSRISSDLNLTINLTSGTYIYILEFNMSPVLNDIPRSPVSNYYKFAVENETAISWPITATITYNETLVSLLGFSENNLIIYYYNYTSNEYKPIPRNQTIINTINNTVTFNITKPIYEAGDPIIVLSGSPPPIGGKLILYSGNKQPIPPILAALLVLTISVSIISILAYKKRR